MKVHIFLILSFLCSPVSAIKFSVPKIKSKAKQAVILHYNSGEVIFGKNHKTIMAPSSMIKIALIYLTLQKLELGHIKLKDTTNVSRKAYQQIGTRMFLKEREKITLEQLLLGVGIVSGNDASYSLAKLISGSPEICAEQMTILVHELGAYQTIAVNPAGIPEPSQVYSKEEFDEYMVQVKKDKLLPINPDILKAKQLDITNLSLRAHANIYGGISTAYDLALIMKDLLFKYPILAIKYLGQKKFAHNGVKQDNKISNLTTHLPSVDCGKTGYTDKGGFGILASSFNKKSKERYIVVVNGCKSKTERAFEAEKLLRFANQNFQSRVIAKKGQVFTKVSTWGGTIPEIEIVAKEDIIITLPRTYLHHKDSCKVKIDYKNLIEPPGKKGDVAGSITISYITSNGELVTRVYPLVLKQDVEKSMLMKRVWQYCYYLVFGRNPGTVIKNIVKKT